MRLDDLLVLNLLLFLLELYLGLHPSLFLLFLEFNEVLRWHLLHPLHHRHLLLLEILQEALHLSISLLSLIAEHRLDL